MCIFYLFALYNVLYFPAFEPSGNSNTGYTVVVIYYIVCTYMCTYIIYGVFVCDMYECRFSVVYAEELPCHVGKYSG